MKRCYVFDIDGTLADCSHRIHLITERSPKEWDEFFAKCKEDEPIHHIIELARSLAEDNMIIFVSGRSDECRQQTIWWLREHVGDWIAYDDVYMRREGDHRDDDIIKIELLAELRSHGYEPIMAFDDRTRVVNAWRAAGIPCAQVAPGDF